MRFSVIDKKTGLYIDTLSIARRIYGERKTPYASIVITPLGQLALVRCREIFLLSDREYEIRYEYDDGIDDYGLVKKLPLELKPRWLVEEERANDLGKYITIYQKAGMQIPIAWVEEYNELVKKIEERKEE
jgi:hypothetical protein